MALYSIYPPEIVEQSLRLHVPVNSAAFRRLGNNLLVSLGVGGQSEVGQGVPVTGIKKESVEFGLAVLDAKLSHVRDDVTEIKDILRGEYIRREEFAPVKQVVFGLVAVIMLAVVGALVTLILR